MIMSWLIVFSNSKISVSWILLNQAIDIGKVYFFLDIDIFNQKV